jgi:hypothetical protein
LYWLFGKGWRASFKNLVSQNLHYPRRNMDNDTDIDCIQFGLIE